MHERAGGVVDEDEERAGRSAIFEPGVIRHVDLDQLARAFPPQARLVKRPTLLARQPQPVMQHPLAQGLARDLQPVIRGQLLGGQRRAEIRVALPDERQRVVPDGRIDAVVRGPAAGLVTDRSRASGIEHLQEPMNLARTEIQHVGRRANRHPPLHDLAQDLDAVQLALAHQKLSVLIKGPFRPISGRPGSGRLPGSGACA